MGNNLGRQKSAKVMKMNGETMKLKTPVRAGEVVKDYPHYALLESEQVKHFGMRAKPLEANQELKPKGLYFLVELPKPNIQEGKPRRVRSGINMSALDRLESLKLSRRSVSDLSSIVVGKEMRERSGVVRVKMRVRKAEVAKLMRESRDEAEAAEKIVGLCAANMAAKEEVAVLGPPPKDNEASLLLHKQQHWSGDLARVNKDSSSKRREKLVGFMPIKEGEIQLATAL